jgi:hypothetical protein
MADLNKIISVNIDDNASAGLKKVDQNITKVTQSTKNLTQETKGHTQSVLDNGGAMGILNELTGGLAMTFKDASEAIGMAGVSLNSFRGIMIATGIGALVIAVGALASNWEAVAEFLHITNKEQDDYIAKQREIMSMDTVRRASQQEYIDTVMLGVDALSLQQAALEKLQELIPTLKDLTLPDDREKILNIVSAYQDYLTLQDKIKVAQDRVGEKQTFLLENEEDYQKLQQEGFNNLDLYQQKRVVEYNDAILELAERKKQLQSLNKEELKYIESLGLTRAEIEKRKKAEEAANKAKEAGNKAREIDEALEKARLERLRKFNEDYYKRLQDLDANTEMKKIDLQEKRALIELAELEGSEKNKLRVYEYYERLRIELRSKYRIQEEQEDKKKNDAFVQGLVTEWEEYKQNQFAQEEIKRLTDEAKFESEMMYWDNVYSITQTSQDLLAVLQDDNLIRAQGLRDALLISEKGLAIAGVWINEAQSSAMATASANAVPTTVNVPGPYGPLTIPNPMKPVAMAGAVKAGVTNKINAGIATAAILAQTIAGLNKRGSGGGGAGSGGVGNQAPQAQFNIVGSSQTNQLAATIGAQQNQTVNAYVVGTDVSTQQALDRNRITNATFLVLLISFNLFSIFMI